MVLQLVCLCLCVCVCVCVHLSTECNLIDNKLFKLLLFIIQVATRDKMLTKLERDKAMAEVSIVIQWNLHIKDTLGPGILSFI